MDNEQFQEFVVKHLMNLSTDVTTLKGDVSSLKGDVSSLKEDVSSLKSTVIRIETRMENEIIDKIKMLSEGNKLHDDRLNRHEKKINDLTKQVNLHDIKLSSR